MSEGENLEVNLSVLEEDILDFLDENVNTGKLTVDDIDSNINKIESM